MTDRQRFRVRTQNHRLPARPFPAVPPVIKKPVSYRDLHTLAKTSCFTASASPTVRFRYSVQYRVTAVITYVHLDAGQAKRPNFLILSYKPASSPSLAPPFTVAARVNSNTSPAAYANKSFILLRYNATICLLGLL